MAICKIKQEAYRNVDAIDRIIGYLLNAEKMPHRCYGGNGISLSHPAQSMNVVKHAYNKTGGKQAEHFVLAFSKQENAMLTITFIEEIAYQICDFFKDVQIFFAVHEVKNSFLSDDYADNCVHIHFVVNTVNIRSGKKFRFDYSNEFSLRNHIQTVLNYYDLFEWVQLVFE